MKRQTTIFFYVLSAYVVLQFLWWGFHLIELSIELADTSEYSNGRILMIIGEGSVFFLILLLGLWKVQSSIKKDIAISRRQSNFLLSVTHELKTPLASNKLYLQTLLKRANLPEAKKTELVKNAIVENNRLEGMIENILTATRIENHKLEISKEDLDLSAFLKSQVKSWSEQRIPVETDIQEGIHVFTDVFIIQTAILNLLDNAYKYGGETPSIMVYLKKEEETVTFGVKDFGVGVPDKFRDSIFEKFTRIGNEETRREKGTGLGLYIVAELLELVNAKIECHPNEPKGTNFKIILNNAQE
jgi:signal transduction histidine kinase